MFNAMSVDAVFNNANNNKSAQKLNIVGPNLMCYFKIADFNFIHY